MDTCVFNQKSGWKCKCPFSARLLSSYPFYCQLSNTFTSTYIGYRIAPTACPHLKLAKSGKCGISLASALKAVSTPVISSQYTIQPTDSRGLWVTVQIKQWSWLGNWKRLINHVDNNMSYSSTMKQCWAISSLHTNLWTLTLFHYQCCLPSTTTTIYMTRAWV